MNLLDGKVVFITGGARGQGRAHALLSAQNGADVVLLDIVKQLDTVPYAMSDPSDLQETVKQVEGLGHRALALEADVRDGHQMSQAAKEAIATFGRIDALIANAGIWTVAPFWELTDAQWDETIGVNLTGVWQTVKAIAPYMLDQRSGSIVITSSSNASRPAYNYAHYIASKAGVTGLMQAVALEVAPYGVRCNAVVPGGTDTPMTNHQDMWNRIAGQENAGPEVWERANNNPRSVDGKSFNMPEDIAKTALYLNSDLASRVSGVSVLVDGGASLSPGGGGPGGGPAERGGASRE